MAIAEEVSAPISVTYRVDRPVDNPFHSHSDYEIYYFHEGKCNYLIGDRIYVLRPGDLIIMHGMTLHRPNIDPNQKYVRSVIQFDPSYAEELFSFPKKVNVLQPFQELGNHRIRLSTDKQSELRELWEKLHTLDRRRNDPVALTRFNIAFMELLVLVYDLFQQTLDEKRDVSPDKVSHVQNVISYIEAHYAEEFHLDHLQDHLHMNKYYLAKIFKEVTDTTIFTYLIQRRINEAKIRFLLEQEVSVTEVSYRVGFKHPSHFSRVFKQKVGCTPEQYRKEARKGHQREINP